MEKDDLTSKIKNGKQKDKRIK